jgi:putative ABC transport system permease protein
MEPAAERLLSSYVIQAAGEPLDDADARGVLLGEGLAENLGLEPGDKVALLATPSAGGVNAVEATVRGIFYTSNKPYDDAAIRMPIALARKLLRVEGSHQWVALLDDTERTDAVVADLRARFRDAGVEFVPWHELADFYHKTVQLFSRQLGLVWVLIGALILLTIANTQTRAVLERTHEIGVLMATGWRRGRVLRFFLVEGLLIGLIGAVGGIMFAFGVANLVEWSGGIPMPPPPGMNRGYTAQIMLNGALVAQAVALALASATAAGAWPAWRASRLDVVDALRHCA